MGYSEEEISTLSIHELFHTSSQEDSYLNYYNNIIDNQTFSKTFEAVLIHKYWTPLYVEISASKIQYNNKDAELVIIRDKTERIEKERELKKLSIAIQQSPASVIITDNKGKIEYVNKAFLLRTGYTHDEVLGKNSSFLKSNYHEPSFYRTLWETINRGLVWNSEIANRKKNGEIYWVKSSISPVKDKNEIITHFVAMNFEITEQKRLEKAKENTERVVRHDLRSPLNAIMGFSQIMMDNTEIQNSRNKKFIDSIYESAEKILHMVNHSTDIYNMEKGTYELNREPLNIIDIIYRIDYSLGSLKKVKQVDINIYFNDRQVDIDFQYTLLADEIYFENMLFNLVKNAVEASPNNKNVTLLLVEAIDVFEIAIHNFGVVPEEIRENFFDPYITSGKKNGTGLGTYSANLIARVHHGDIRFTSSKKEGTKVIVKLPITNE